MLKQPYKVKKSTPPNSQRMKNTQYVLALGELLVDAITQVPVDNLSQAELLKIHPGGSAANFSRYLYRCGTDVRLCACIGSDGFGDILLRKLQLDQLPLNYIHSSSNHNTSMIVVGRSSGTPDFIPYRDADMQLPAIDTSLINEAALVHTTAFSLSKQPARQHILNAFEQAYQQGIPVSVDWNYSEKIWGTNNDSEAVFAHLQTLHPLMKFSLDDISRFIGHTATIAEALDFLQPLPFEIQCLTCGADGVYYKTTQNDWQFLAAEKIKVENATGAGDAFWAGFVHAYCSGHTHQECVQHGIQVASLKLQAKLRRRELI